MFYRIMKGRQEGRMREGRKGRYWKDREGGAKEGKKEGITE